MDGDKNKAAATRRRARLKAIANGEPIPEWAAVRKRGVPKQLVTREQQLEASKTATQRYREKNQDLIKERLRERQSVARAYVIEAKSNPCMDCGGSFHPVSMDFDHRPGETKYGGTRGGVSMMVNLGRSTEVIQTEIDKCDLVCANCHRVRTHVTRRANRRTAT